RMARGERVVGHQDHGQMPLLVEAPQQVEDRLPRLRVEVARRLVGQEEPRLGHEGARDGDALLLAARELGGPAARRRRRERHLGERLLGAPARLPPGDAQELQRPGHVLLRREGGEQVEALEGEADLAQSEGAAGVVPQVGAVASTPRARPAATSTGGPITTIVDASGTVAVAREPMGGRFAMPEYVSNYCAKA